MPKVNLTEARVRGLKRRKAAYDIRDGKLTGFGVRVENESSRESP